MRFGPFARRSIRRAYVEGVLDAAQDDGLGPFPGRYGDPGSAGRRRVMAAMTNARRAGYADAKAGTPRREHDFDAERYRASGV